MKQPKSKLNKSSLDGLNEYSTLLIEPYYYKLLRQYLQKDAITHAAIKIKNCTKYYIALLTELGSLNKATRFINKSI